MCAVGFEIKAGPAVVGIDENGFGWKQSFPQHELAAVNVEEQRVDEARALAQAGFEFRPLGGGQHERRGLEFPEGPGVAGVLEHEVGQSGVADIGAQARPKHVALGGTETRKYGRFGAGGSGHRKYFYTKIAKTAKPIAV